MRSNIRPQIKQDISNHFVDLTKKRYVHTHKTHGFIDLNGIPMYTNDFIVYIKCVVLAKLRIMLEICRDYVLLSGYAIDKNDPTKCHLKLKQSSLRRTMKKIGYHKKNKDEENEKPGYLFIVCLSMIAIRQQTPKIMLSNRIE